MNDTPQDTLDQLKEALFTGRKIEAIKIYREARGVSLKEAKEDMEKLERELRERSPEKFSRPGAQGCLGAVLALATALSTGLFAVAHLAARSWP